MYVKGVVVEADAFTAKVRLECGLVLEGVVIPKPAKAEVEKEVTVRIRSQVAMRRR